MEIQKRRWPDDNVAPVTLYSKSSHDIVRVHPRYTVLSVKRVKQIFSDKFELKKKILNISVNHDNKLTGKKLKKNITFAHNWCRPPTENVHRLTVRTYRALRLNR